MYIQFDPKTMHLQVIVGSLEKYEPTEDIKELQEKVSKLSEKIQKFKKEEVEPELLVIHDKIAKKNEELQKPLEKPKKEESKE